MSSKKRFNVDCELRLHYGLVIYANTEEEAEEKARDRLELIAETQKYKKEMTDHESDIGDVELL
jgi:hypothetical protein